MEVSTLTVTTRVFWLGLVAVLLIISSLVLSIIQGDVVIPAQEAILLLFSAEDSTNHFVIHDLRLPRVLVGCVVGAALGMAGAIVQSITRNPLGSPDLMGVSAGASLAIVMSFVLLDVSIANRLWIGTGGGAMAAFLTFSIAWQTRLHPLYLTLAGMSVAIFCSAGIMIFLVAAADEANGLYFWLIGGLADRTWDHVYQLYPWAFAGLLFAMLFSRQLNLLMLGDDICKSLGLHVLRWRFVLGVIAVILTAASVSVAGPIGFVGLIVPHLVRLSLGDIAGNHRVLLPLSGLVGAALIAVADLIAKLQNVPVGILTALVGGPLFIYLIKKQVN